jgi:hypothetical protein
MDDLEFILTRGEVWVISGALRLPFVFLAHIHQSCIQLDTTSRHNLSSLTMG